MRLHVYACGHCGRLIVGTRPGRGRDQGEHPDHEFSLRCGHNLDHYGRRLVGVVTLKRTEAAA